MLQKLSNIKTDSTRFISANLPCNKHKNRLVHILPFESTRVCLTPVRTIEGSDYINASFIDGYRYRAAYIATQGPLLDTTEDFWRMLWEHNSTIVVMLTKLKEMGRVSSYVEDSRFFFWFLTPEDRTDRLSWNVGKNLPQIWTFSGPCIVSIFWYISNKMQRYTLYLFLETALHVSGGISTHHQEHIQLHLQHLILVKPLLLPAAIVEELELQFQLLHNSGR